MKTQPLARLARCAALATLALVAAASSAAQADVITVFNFNDSDLVVDRGAGTLTTDVVADNITFFGGTTLNADSGDAAGQALALQNGTDGVNNGRNLTVLFDTTDLEDIIVSFAARRSSTGFNDNQFQVTTDGSTFTDFGAAFAPVTNAFGVFSFDLGAIAGIEDNINAGFRIVFGGGSTTSSAGNNRFDNIVVSGTEVVNVVPEPSTVAMLATGAVGLVGLARRRRSR